MPRVNFVSFTFLFAFGLGSFVGIGLALLAIALAAPDPEPTIIEPSPASAVEAPTRTPTVEPSATPEPTPVPVIRTLSTLQVHIGPDDGFAVLGTLAGGSEIDVQGRDSEARWVAIMFPPGSSARGWIPADEVEGLTPLQIYRLGVLQATSFDTAPATRTPVSFNGNDGFESALDSPTGTPETATPVTQTPQPLSTPTPRPIAFGPTDLAFAGVGVDSDGRLSIVVENLGPGDVPGSGLTVSVSVNGIQRELLGASGVLRAGDTAVLRTSEVQLTEPASIALVIDPSGQLTDLNRSNNTFNVTLRP